MPAIVLTQPPVARYPATMWALQVLVIFDVLPDAESVHVAVEVLMLLLGLIGGIFG